MGFRMKGKFRDLLREVDEMTVRGMAEVVAEDFKDYSVYDVIYALLKLYGEDGLEMLARVWYYLEKNKGQKS